MSLITWACLRCVQELTTILGPQNRTQGSCEQQWTTAQMILASTYICRNMQMTMAIGHMVWNVFIKFYVPVIANSRLVFRPNSVEGLFLSGQFDGYIAHLVNSIAVTFSSICYFNYWAFDCIACSNFYQKYRKQKSLRQEFEHSVIKWHIQFCIVLDTFIKKSCKCVHKTGAL